MADGDYERRGAREAELLRIRRALERVKRERDGIVPPRLPQRAGMDSTDNG